CPQIRPLGCIRALTRRIMGAGGNPPANRAAQRYTSLYTFPAALDFFLACWRNVQNYRLASFYRATTLAQLTADCQSLIDFRSRLSTIAGTLAQPAPKRALRSRPPKPSGPTVFNLNLDDPQPHHT